MEKHGAHDHKEGESDEEAEDSKAADSESKQVDSEPQPTAALDDALGDDELDAEMMAALGGQKSLPQGIMTEDDLNRMVRGASAFAWLPVGLFASSTVVVVDVPAVPLWRQ
jgi:hypothetical protein